VTKQRLRFFEKAASQQHIQDDHKYLYKTPEPDHRLAIIGTGTIGQEHMYVCTLLGRGRVYGIYDQQLQSMDVAKQNFQSYSDQPLVLYPDIETLCNDVNVDAIMICTPNFTHFSILKQAMSSGKPIFIEKPMATNLENSASLVELASNYSSFVQIGLQYRYKAQYIEAFHELHSRQSIGDIKTISMSEYRPPFLDKVDQWNKFSESSGGTLVEKCCHYFDLINLIADSAATRVYASGGQAVNFLDLKHQGRSANIDDHAFVIIDFANGVRANFTLNMFCHDFTEELVVTGGRGRLTTKETFNFHQNKPSEATIGIEKGEWGASWESRVAYSQEIEKSGHHGATYYEHVAFMDQLDGIVSDSATPLQGLWSIIVASAAQHSMQTGQVVDIRKFMLDNNLANHLG
jgi:myo-inositol 2-dehydrogenase/D-chiro-inositol 1-dehydrogenase